MGKPDTHGRVLIVDDEETVRHVLRQVLEENGCEVIEAGSAEEGLSLVDGLSFDVAMLDIVLPGMSGIQLLKAIEEVAPQTQVVMMTSHASLETTLDAIRHGAYAYLQKPFDELDQIWATVSRALEKRSLMGLLEEREFELRKASEANLAKSQFLAVISHELRTPLNAILGFSELLHEEAATIPRDKLSADLQKIILAGERLCRQINDILDVSNLDSGKFEILRSGFNLRAVVDRVRDKFEGLAEAKGLRLDVVLDPDVAVDLVGDRERLLQILAKIADNAIKFSESGTVAVHVSRDGARSDSADVRFEISDSGIGVSDASRDRIFEMFRQEDTSIARKYDGVGLGLAIAKRLVEAMGGVIGVRRNGDQGSTFWFTVPFQLQPAAAEQTVSA